jgi:hypothetical protein
MMQERPLWTPATGPMALPPCVVLELESFPAGSNPSSEVIKPPSRANQDMADKHHTTTTRAPSSKAGKHGTFRNTAKPASLNTVLRTYGISKESFREVKEYVSGHLEKKPAHAR